MNASAVLLSWQHPEASGRNGIIVSYAIMLTELATGRMYEYSSVGNRIDILITSLHPYYEYQCSVAAATTTGRGPFAPAIIVQTEEAGMRLSIPILD